MTPSTINNPKLSNALSVSELNRQVKRMLEVSYGQLWVCGEISGLSRPNSGHWYFNLKDDKAQIRCAMFKGFNQRLKFLPKEGNQILVRGKVSLYEGRGDYQLIVDNIEPAGLGQLQAAFEALKLKLSNEGLFNADRKRAIPAIPQKLAVITSSSGAVIHDIISVTQRRFPALEIIVVAVAVQGEGAAREIADAIHLVNDKQVADVIIVGRGGGSLEDLWAFNEEIVARAIFDSRIPIISAVGHEVDFTIADLVADYRAPTPSAAAEKVTPDQFELMQQLDQQQRSLHFFMQNKLQILSDKLTHVQQRLKHPGETLRDKELRLQELHIRLHQAIKTRLALFHQQADLCIQSLSALNPSNQLQQQKLAVAHLYEQLISAQKNLLSAQQHRLAIAAQTLNTASPLATLGRGYAIIGSTEKKVITSHREVSIGDQLTATLKDGILDCTVTDNTRKNPSNR